MGGDDELSFGQKVANQWNGFKDFMWDGENKRFMGRSGKSWAKIGLFYLVLYFFLACFWAAMLFIFLQTVDPNKPKFTAYVSTPGLNYVPATSENVIAFTPDNENTYKKLTDTLTKTYKAINETIEPREGCIGNDTRCSFDIDTLGYHCTPPYFGYDKGEPCVLVNLNRVYNWEPEEYPADDQPEGIYYEPGNIAISCKAYKEKYAKNYNTTEVYPPAGIPFSYFPYNPAAIGGKKQYATPWVAIRFVVVPGTEAKVECRTYTANIKPKKGLYDTDQESKFVVEFNIKPTKGKDEL
ncbi:sodium/potassium-transporting ATPase subunit beta-1-like isoform X2 [Amphiura filiformis]|uniref:sodium/potassium-transporting ATPase subunit beta-1-like isoform X2 n=1 Tax=Amphiura filiformis TaxID=82378 RepID=UPI003B21A91C